MPPELTQAPFSHEKLQPLIADSEHSPSPAEPCKMQVCSQESDTKAGITLSGRVLLLNEGPRESALRDVKN